MFTGEIDAYILSHIDEEGDLLSALNRDANVNLLRPRMLSGHLQGVLPDDSSEKSLGDRDLYVLCHFVYGGRHGRGGVDPYDRDQ